MNRHNFLQFNPNCYKKHLSPFGRNVLDTLIRHWRTGFDNNESRRLYQLNSNQNRRNTIRESYGNTRSIPSVPSSPAGQVYDDRRIYRSANFDENYDPLPEMPRDQGYPTTSNNLIDNDKDIYQTPFKNDNFAMPRPVGEISIRSTSANRQHTKDMDETIQNTRSNLLIQQYDSHKQINDMPNMPIKTLFGDGTNSKPNETVLTTDDLAKTVEIANTNEEEILTANDMITPVINFNNINENLLSSTRKPANNIADPNMPAKKFLEILNQEMNNKTSLTSNELITNKNEAKDKNINWDDMFDSELFPDLKTPRQLLLPLENKKDNTFKIVFPNDKKSKQDSSINKVIKRKNHSQTNVKVNKIKKVTGEHSNDSDNTSKKNVRKVKYTKAVKNWLDDIDPNNPVEVENVVPANGARNEDEPIRSAWHEVHVDENNLDACNSRTKYVVTDIVHNPRDNILRILLNNNNTSEIVNAEEIKTSKTTVINDATTVRDSSSIATAKKLKPKNKKTIQTRLAEKDGKMKFGPPVKGQIGNSTDGTVDNETNSKETKEKKTKAKFVPPIKSQLPVKNITFDVHTINESNVHMIHDLIESDDKDLAMVVVYSNGFCQLNNHHTEDTCVPEGIMIQAQNYFFYIKDREINEQNCDFVRRLLEISNVKCYNGKRLLTYLIAKYGLELKPNAFNLNDAKIGASLIDPDNPPENFAELQKLLGFTPEFTIATECMLQKTAWYITLLRECSDKLKTLLEQNSVWYIFVEIEMPLLPVIAGMEYLGVCVDLDKIKSMENILLTKMKSVEQECYKAAGKTFQINSTLQVRTILYDELQLDTKSNLKIKETIGKGAKSTSETMLRGLVSVHPLPRLILEYRHLHKAHATFLTGIAQHVKDGTVKPTWEQMAAATGRIASNNPNLQAIPKAPFSLVVFPEQSDEQEPPLNFRSVYTARPHHKLLAADFKHIECRVFAHAADDATLQEALRSGQDLFKVLAAKWLNKSVDSISSEDRERTKRIVYASLYGAGARKLMEILHVSYEQALSIATSFNRTFPALKCFGRAAVSSAARGSLRTLCGRARRFPHISSADAALRAQAERRAVNFVVQGSAADLCKMAMVAVQRRLSPELRCRLLLQIHDELVWEIADGDVHAAAVIIKETMENVGRDCGMDMTLPVELTVGKNWGEMQPFPQINDP